MRRINMGIMEEIVGQSACVGLVKFSKIRTGSEVSRANGLSWTRVVVGLIGLTRPV
jgi:hypothetical protein